MRYTGTYILPYHLSGASITAGSLKFTSWMECNKVNPDAMQLTYTEFFAKFVWDRKKKCWKPRCRGGSKPGRLAYCPDTSGEIYYLRLLLLRVKGATSFDSIKTVAGVVYPTFKDACHVLGLVDDVDEYAAALWEASRWYDGSVMPILFSD